MYERVVELVAYKPQLYPDVTIIPQPFDSGCFKALHLNFTGHHGVFMWQRT